MSLDVLFGMYLTRARTNYAIECVTVLVVIAIVLIVLIIVLVLGVLDLILVVAVVVVDVVVAVDVDFVVVFVLFSSVLYFRSSTNSEAAPKVSCLFQFCQRLFVKSCIQAIPYHYERNSQKVKIRGTSSVS